MTQQQQEDDRHHLSGMQSQVSTGQAIVDATAQQKWEKGEPAIGNNTAKAPQQNSMPHMLLIQVEIQGKREPLPFQNCIQFITAKASPHIRSPIQKLACQSSRSGNTESAE
ncbi:hypothetical protein Nepgr_030962 [Nepenthes gracilis]|uniref:Uncharacterized protein n=1 Tax=Nepenthes gracilis TaxID=150966 RepID=A0AAD3THE3_NEPGR|nr:hypothetical protein Nepgr_030962 [Nepenthes gracilis]